MSFHLHPFLLVPCISSCQSVRDTVSEKKGLQRKTTCTFWLSIFHMIPFPQEDSHMKDSFLEN